MTVQTSLFDVTGFDERESGLWGGPDRSVPPLHGLVRHQLGRGAWIDLLPGWLAGSSGLLPRLLDAVDWQAERRQMYDRVVAVPRLLSFYGERDRLPDADLDAARAALDAHYAVELGEPFRTAGLCLYRDGADSVAWHGDTIGRGASADTMVAIVSLGSPREFLLRPRGGSAIARSIAAHSRSSAAAGVSRPAPAGSGGVAATGSAVAVKRLSGAGTIRHTLQHGDLIVMGGSCQRTWEHSIPKTTRPVGPRVSVQFRPRGVR